jgi:hypothetical protein
MSNLLLLLALLAADVSASGWSRAEYAGVFTDPELDEVSGLAASHAHPGLYWAHNDGGSLRPAWTINFRWPDGARDCEATAVDAANGEILLISKKRVPPELFRLPLQPGPELQTAQLLTTLPGIGQPSEEQLKKNPVYGRYRSQVSGADLSPNGRVLAVLNYYSVHTYVRAPGQDWPQAMKTPPGELVFPWLPQAEGIAYSADGRSLLIGSEQRPSPLLRFRVLR